MQESFLILLRAHPNLCVQLAPGYVHSSTVSSWLLSFGISASTSSIDFTAGDKAAKKDVTPSFEELEKQIQQEKKKEN